jgi:adenylosuccinate lyase
MLVFYDEQKVVRGFRVTEYDPKIIDIVAEHGEPPLAVRPRDRHAEVFWSLAMLGTSLEKIAVEIRQLQKTEVLEVEEPFSAGQKGSSSMPHKRNPVRCERISGLARILRGNLAPALENNLLWHERDISHSSAERIIFPDFVVS